MVQPGAALAYPTESYTRRSDRSHVNERDWTTHVFVWNARPFTMNQANAKRWAWIEARREWRDAFTGMAKDCAPLAWCNVTVDHLTATRRNVDVAACLPSFKAALDGIVLAGVLTDDDATHVRKVTFNAPLFAARDALILTMEGPARDDA